LARKAQISIVVGTLALCFGAVGAWAVDTSQSDRVAKGVRVGGVDIGGRPTSVAARQLRTEILKPLQRPVVVTFSGEKFKLTPKRLRLRADIDGMIAEAREVSRDGSLPSRLWRYATDAEVDRDIQPRVAYSQQAIEGFVDELKRKIDRPVRNASVAPGPSSVNPVPGRSGVQLLARRLRQKIDAAVQDPVGDRRIHATVRHVEPEVTIAQLASRYPTYITVDRSAHRLNFFRNLKPAKSYPIAVGMVGLETPAGLYTIQNKGENVPWQVPNSDWAGSLAGKTIPGGAPDNPLKARWMGIFAGAGIHGTDEIGSLGSNASHGCIRMAIPDVIDLYGRVSVGTPVYIGN
jgi:lipoprotein-anchoring transpeptidase ErfK/SrfK